MVYAAFALALVLIWRSTRVVNFAQAPMAMVTTFIALVVIDAGYSYWLGFAAALLSGLVLGAFLERVVVRPVEGKAEINAVILTLGLFIVLHAAGGGRLRQRVPLVPGAVRIRGFEIGDRTFALTGFGVFTIVAVLVVMGLLVALFRYTDVGLRMRAAAFNAEVARLLGVRVGRMMTLGWALASVVGSLAGLLIAGGSLVHPGYMDSVVVFGFVAAVLGGLDSPLGARGRRPGAGPLVELRQRLHRLTARRARGPADPDAGADPAPRRPLLLHPRQEGLMDRTSRAARLVPRSPLARHLLTAALGDARRGGGAQRAERLPALQMAEMAYLGIAVGGLTVLTGLNGQLSLGHGALMAFGAYTTALLLPDRDASTPLLLVVLASRRWSPWSSAPPSERPRPGCTGPTSPARRWRSPSPCRASRSTSRRPSAASRACASCCPRPPAGPLDAAYFVTGQDLTNAAGSPSWPGPRWSLTYVLLANLSRSRVGRRWRAVRDDEVAAQLAGIDLGRARVSAFMVSAAAAGAAGAMLALTVRLAAPSCSR